MERAYYGHGTVQVTLGPRDGRAEPLDLGALEASTCTRPDDGRLTIELSAWNDVFNLYCWGRVIGGRWRIEDGYAYAEADGWELDLALGDGPIGPTAAPMEWEVGALLRGEATLSMSDGVHSIPLTLRFEHTEFEES